jgi:hypothetical protein
MSNKSKFSEISVFAKDIMHAVEASYKGTYCTIQPEFNKAGWTVVVSKLGPDGLQYYNKEYITDMDLHSAHNAKQLLMNVVDKCLEGLEKTIPKEIPTQMIPGVTYTQAPAGTWAGFPAPSKPMNYIPFNTTPWSKLTHKQANPKVEVELTSFKDLYAAAPPPKPKKAKVKLTAAQKQAQKEGKNINPPSLAQEAFAEINKITLDEIYKPSPFYKYISGVIDAPDPTKSSVEQYKAQEKAYKAANMGIQSGSQLKEKISKHDMGKLDEKLQKYLDSIEEPDED